MHAVDELSREALVEKISELEDIITFLRDQKDQQELVDMPWVGNLGTWQWHYPSNRVLFNQRKIEVLGYTSDDLKEDVGFQFFTEKVHPDDHEGMMENMRAHLRGQSDAYEFEYRIQTKGGDWVWFYDRGKVVQRDKAGKPVMLSGIVFDITAQKKMQEHILKQKQELEILAHTDALTQLDNRRFVMEKLDYELRRAKRYQHPLCLILMDIDHFKQINDKHGHDIGDKALIMVASTLREQVRITDIVGRYGGEEFLLILPESSRKEGLLVAEKLRKAVMRIKCEPCGQITLSGGLAEYKNETPEELIRKADASLYKAKEGGRNRIEG